MSQASQYAVARAAWEQATTRDQASDLGHVSSCSLPHIPYTVPVGTAHKVEAHGPCACNQKDFP